MKRIILMLIVFFNLMPSVKKGRIGLQVQNLYGQQSPVTSPIADGIYTHSGVFTGYYYQYGNGSTYYVQSSVGNSNSIGGIYGQYSVAGGGNYVDGMGFAITTSIYANQTGTTKPKKDGEDTGGSEAFEVTEPDPLPPAETPVIPTIVSYTPSGDPGTVAINTTTTIGGLGAGTGITVMQPPTFTTTTPCQKASEQLGKQNLKTRIKELNGKTSGNHEWGQVIKESFQNNVDFSKNINGIIQSVDDLTPGSDATIDPNGTTIYRYKLPKFSLDNKSEDNPRVIGYIHSHTDDIFPSCFSPADLVIFQNACAGSLNNTFDDAERTNYFNDAIGIMVDKNNVYTVKITDPAGFCDLIGSKTLDVWGRLFDDAAKVPTDDNNGKQGQSVAFLQLFGKVVSLQQAKIDGTTGNLDDFKHLTLADERYLPPNDPLNPIDSKKIKPVDCGK